MIHTKMKHIAEYLSKSKGNYQFWFIVDDNDTLKVLKTKLKSNLDKLPGPNQQELLYSLYHEVYQSLITMGLWPSNNKTIVRELGDPQIIFKGVLMLTTDDSLNRNPIGELDTMNGYDTTTLIWERIMEDINELPIKLKFSHLYGFLDLLQKQFNRFGLNPININKRNSFVGHPIPLITLDSEPKRNENEPK